MTRSRNETLSTLTENEILAIFLDARKANDDRVAALHELDLRAGVEPDEDWYYILEHDAMELDAAAADIWSTGDGAVPLIDDEGNETWLPEY